MALDTANRRASAIAFDFSWGHIFPVPDGTIDQADRQQIAYKYPGIAADTPPSGDVGKYRTLLGIGA